jgi:hypothetical protein
VDDVAMTSSHPLKLVFTFYGILATSGNYRNQLPFPGRVNKPVAILPTAPRCGTPPSVVSLDEV